VWRSRCSQAGRRRHSSTRRTAPGRSRGRPPLFRHRQPRACPAAHTMSPKSAAAMVTDALASAPAPAPTDKALPGTAPAVIMPGYRSLTLTSMVTPMRRFTTIPASAFYADRVKSNEQSVKPIPLPRPKQPQHRKACAGLFIASETQTKARGGDTHKSRDGADLSIPEQQARSSGQAGNAASARDQYAALLPAPPRATNPTPTTSPQNREICTTPPAPHAQHLTCS
jgi:hypothetical protein